VRIAIATLLFVIITLSITVAIITDIRWTITMLCTSIVYGALSPAIAARRLYFLAAAAPHTALFSALLAIPIAIDVGYLPLYLWALILGIPLINIVAYMVRRGVDPDVATSILVAFTASGSVILMNVVREVYSSYNVWSYIVGDPLLVSENQLPYLTTVALMVLTLVVLSYREILVLGIDRDSVFLAGVRTRVYDFLLFTLIAIAAIAMIGVVGFVLEHILILLPASIAIALTDSAFRALILSIAISVVSGLLGLALSLYLGIAPAGAIGMILLLIYIGTIYIQSVRKVIKKVVKTV